MAVTVAEIEFPVASGTSFGAGLHWLLDASRCPRVRFASFSPMTSRSE